MSNRRGMIGYKHIKGNPLFKKIKMYRKQN